MGMLVFNARRGVLHGSMMGPAAFQAPSVAEAPAPAPPAGLLQMAFTLQRIGEQH